MKLAIAATVALFVLAVVDLMRDPVWRIGR